MRQDNETVILTTEQAAKYLGVATRTLYDKMYKGEWNIPQIQYANSSRVYYEKKDLDDFIEKSKKQSAVAK